MLKNVIYYLLHTRTLQDQEGNFIINRTAWRAISSIQQKEEAKGGKNVKHLLAYKKKIESELDKFCMDILKLIDSNILSTCHNCEAKVFFYKMKADYYRYISEYAAD